MGRPPRFHVRADPDWGRPFDSGCARLRGELPRPTTAAFARSVPPDCGCVRLSLARPTAAAFAPVWLARRRLRAPDLSALAFWPKTLLTVVDSALAGPEGPFWAANNASFGVAKRADNSMRCVMAGEAPRAKLSGMNQTTSALRRSTQQTREASRLTRVTVINLGQDVKRARRGLRLKQRELGLTLGVTQAWISRIELGHGQGVPLERWIALGVALGRPLAVSLSRPLGQMREPTDAGHLAMQERLLRLARETGRPARFELPSRPADPRHSIDVCVSDPRHRVLIIQEAWNTFGDIGAATRSTNRKVAEAHDLAATIDDGPPFRVASVWVVRSNATNRTLVARYPEIFRSAFPGSSRRWAAALRTGSTPPNAPGLVWLDPATGRITEWRRG